jgi:hypothetical protein
MKKFYTHRPEFNDIVIDGDEEGFTVFNRLEAIKLRNFLNSFINGELEEQDEYVEEVKAPAKVTVTTVPGSESDLELEERMARKAKWRGL